ncbi:hypothetical protein [Variovorax sp. LT1R16]|uniref:hypothetical protein n=1 Tax=Variovorax sp. LT1R16 TaxID=3443728 RepID=UPI003F44A646
MQELSAIVYASVLAAFLPAERPRRAYLRFKAAIDRMAGGVMMLLELKLVLSGHRA